jgi:glycyl-tRNA synthetase
LPEENVYDKVIDLAKRRGFFWPSYEIYGGQAGFYDIGPYGMALKKKLIDMWRELFIRNNQDSVVEVETPVIGPSIVYQASGHIENFTDPIVRCNDCGRIFRADHLVEERLNVNAEGLSASELSSLIKEKGLRCPVCNGELGEVKVFNLLFKTQIGPYEGNVGYVRPELAQGIFVAFKRIYESLRNKLPLGIAQVGKVGRNEISPRQGMIRLRDFTIMEMEYFFNPDKKECHDIEKYYNETLNILPFEYKKMNKSFVTVTVKEAIERNFVINPCMAYWMIIGKLLLLKIGVPENNMYFEEKGPKERAHYSSQTFDHMVKTSRWGWIEVAGYAYRGDYDLSRHKQFSNADLEVFEPYKEPITIKVKKVLLDKAYAGKNFKSKAYEFMKKVEELDVDQVLKEIEEKGKITIDNVDIPKEALIIIEKEEKVSGRKFIPHVIEPSFGTDRLLYVLLEYAYREVDGRVVLSFPRYLSPADAAVLPLIEGDEKLISKSKEFYSYLISEGFNVLYDDNGSIGKRYARADEIGVPVVFTIDYQTLEDDTITMRDRDSWKQVRINIRDAANSLRKFIYNSADLRELGKEVEIKG